MGLFDWLRRKPPAPTTPASTSEIEVPAEYLALIETTRMSYAHINIGARTDDVRASKLGGVPYRPQGGRYDVLLADGEMSFVAQIRCDELPTLPELAAFPREGLLQFWVVELYSTIERADGRVCLYYPSTEPAQLENWAPSFEPDDSPLEEPSVGRALFFAVETECMPATDYRWHALLERGGLGERHDEIFDMEVDLDRHHGAGHRVGGYCAFAQEDPRRPDDLMVSLLQLDSEQGVMWGDAGVGHWFLREKDLRARWFDNTLFTWDCH